MSYTFLCGWPPPGANGGRGHTDVVYDAVEGNERSNTNDAKEGIPLVVLGERAVSRFFFSHFDQTFSSVLVTASLINS